MSDIDPITQARLRLAFDRLPHIHAIVLLAVRHDGLTYGEIAERCGITPLDAERILADALYRLHADVSEQERGITIHPIRRFVRERSRDLRLWFRLRRDRR